MDPYRRRASLAKARAEADGCRDGGRWPRDGGDELDDWLRGAPDPDASPLSTALARLAGDGDARAALELIEANPGIDLDANGEDWGVPLHRACGMGRFECASLLLSKGAGPNVLDSRGNTPLDCVAMGGVAADSRAMAMLLARWGARVGQAGPHGLTPLLLACRSSNVAAAQALVELGADLRALSPSRKGAWDLALEAGRGGRAGRRWGIGGARSSDMLGWLEAQWEREEIAGASSGPARGRRPPRPL